MSRRKIVVFFTYTLTLHFSVSVQCVSLIGVEGLIKNMKTCLRQNRLKETPRRRWWISGYKQSCHWLKLSDINLNQSPGRETFTNHQVHTARTQWQQASTGMLCPTTDVFSLAASEWSAKHTLLFWAQIVGVGLIQTDRPCCRPLMSPVVHT